jgi:hypothetical protein
MRICYECSYGEHDTCPLVEGCSCCEDTVNRMDDELT